ncbi:hypothetical protein R2B70_03395 [Aeromonas sp. XH]|uniref:hypothetical protein n=1 Tax=Aeromonas sp. XH TaxID=3081770 RepID=UPI002966142E|nr:hypothetical protein [Aeromonas sp. XH]WOX49049.1 hypothetical protein R2B70_03395 [Aeromonas sp. XH]
MSNENKIAYLGFIQAIISRMASNAFAIKGWSVSITSAIVAAGIALKSIPIIAIALVPMVIFIFLDSYFFLQEKNYRELYNSARQKEFDGNNSFDLTPPQNIYKMPWRKRVVELFERAVFPVYLTQLILVLSTMLIMA